MQRLYSQSTGATYFEKIHSSIPVDALPITEARYQEVIANPVPGKIRTHDTVGLPVLIEQPAGSADDLEASERIWRNAEVSATEWLVTRHRDQQDMQLATTLRAEQYAELLHYRQDLRDWPQSAHFPVLEHRPVAPPWTADQSQ